MFLQIVLLADCCFVQIVHSSGVPLPAAAREAAECAAALPAIAPVDPCRDWADDERWLRFTAVMEAAGALGTDAALALPPGTRNYTLRTSLHRLSHFYKAFLAEEAAEACAQLYPASATLALATCVLAQQARTAQ